MALTGIGHIFGGTLAVLSSIFAPPVALTLHGFQPETRTEGALKLHALVIATWQANDTVKGAPFRVVLHVQDAAGRANCDFRVTAAQLRSGEQRINLPPAPLQASTSPTQPNTAIYTAGALALAHQDHQLNVRLQSQACNIDQTVQLPLVYQVTRKTITWWDRLMSV